MSWEWHHPFPVLEAGTRPRTPQPPRHPFGALGDCRVILSTAFLTPSPHPSCSGAGREGCGFLPLPGPDARVRQQLLGDQLGTKATRSSPIPPYTLEGTRADLQQGQRHHNTTLTEKKELDLRTPSPWAEL